MAKSAPVSFAQDGAYSPAFAGPKIPPKGGSALPATQLRSNPSPKKK
jgi:hypothetical protein